MVGMLQPRIGGKQSLGRLTCLFQHGPVASQVGNSQRRQAMLLGSKKVARSAQFKIHLSESKTISGRGERVEPRAGLRYQSFMSQDTAKSGQLTTPNAPAQLMQLR